MNLKITIRQFIASFLLLVFALGSTPKKFLHDAVTKHNHQHNTKVTCKHHHINIGAAGSNCQTDNLVVEMPFLAALHPVFGFVITFYFEYSQPKDKQLISTNFCLVYLRGPPIC